MLDRNDTLLVVIDVQERMMPAISGGDEVTAQISRLAAGCRQLEVPILVTEQYTRGLGPTVEPVQQALGEWYNPLEKIAFSACKEVSFMNRLETAGRQEIILCGVETHICVYQTAMDLRELGYSVHMVVDAVGSRSPHNTKLALKKVSRHGIEHTSVEMFLFELMERADIREFKAVQSIVK